tara:strand:- start:203 stop:466 length:264 start_codon:yes stop_codon:yes gene_type:complete
MVLKNPIENSEAPKSSNGRGRPKGVGSTGPGGVKKRSNKAGIETYSVYIYRVLKQVHHEQFYKRRLRKDLYGKRKTCKQQQETHFEQ